MPTRRPARTALSPTGAASIDGVTVNAVLNAVRQAANVLCDRWSLLTLLLAHAGVSRFSDFSVRGGMASRLLTSRLAMLEEQEILIRMPYSRRPLRHDYYPTHMGLALFDVFATMVRWERRWHPGADGIGLAIEHLACGRTATVPVPRCAACAADLAAREIRLQVSQRGLEAMAAKPTAYRRSTHSTARLDQGPEVPLAHAIDVFGDKWGIELVMCVFTRIRHFSGFRDHLGIATNILADRLARLVALGILQPTSASARHGKGAYELTDKGIDLFPILLAIQAWADAWLRDRVRSPIRFEHRPCGRPLQMHICCEGCGAALTRQNSRLTLGRTLSAEDARPTPPGG